MFLADLCEVRRRGLKCYGCRTVSLPVLSMTRGTTYHEEILTPGYTRLLFLRSANQRLPQKKGNTQEREKPVLDAPQFFSHRFLLRLPSSYP
jgi:hypothetical protein